MMADQGATAKPRSELALRVVSSLVLAPLVLGATWYGGWPFGLLWLVAAVAVWWEWCGLVDQPSRWTVFALGTVGIVIAALALEFRQSLIAIGVLLATTVLATALAAARREWSGAGVIYSGAVALSPVMLRQDSEWGLVAIVLLFAVVWGTDIAGYFGGRAIGGPKLWPAVSPKKTWSGALSGLALTLVLSVLLGWIAGVRSVVVLALVGIVLSAVSQAGDLFESSMKRHFGAKDSGNLIPGHGGVMDRLDGFIFAAAAALLIGLAHTGLESPSRGLLIW
ncbi:phosphatidate cytidylyltransferase [Variibacter gotjawalensis]|uniref:Phosphatidate cytidylyltransferase n=1 Tax=Variibacter gotjawalensis TaxID=1333996 RepID=A0A0S3PWL6_9BRAD|nr:phosphatidate cytidylyltransferase [Variibacter gotjawalensis]NIK46102.1 phosphatidate cytidylyltransferase [Variibacter gotjawalensis]RZS48020.1 phosphatidate cytidylyltransferase [Variibacter gotjawalensis]BAT60276.1 phosphatidate cytidylyltransferase [Variibacter gotjawalensis]